MKSVDQKIVVFFLLSLLPFFGQGLILLPRLSLNLKSSCLSFLNSRITGMHYLTQCYFCFVLFFIFERYKGKLLLEMLVLVYNPTNNVSNSLSVAKSGLLLF